MIFVYFLLLVCAFSQENAPLDPRFEQLNQKIDQVEKLVNTQVTSMSNKFDEFQSNQVQEQKALKQQLDSLKQQQSQDSRQLTNAQQQVQETLDQTVTLMTSTAESLVSLEEHAVDVSKRLGDIETETRSSKNDGTSSGLEEAVSAVKASVKSMQAENNSLVKRVQDLEQVSQSSHTTHSSNTEKLQDSLAATIAQVDALSSFMEKQDQAFGELTESLQGQQRLSKETMDKTRKMISELVEQNEVLTAQVEALKRANQEQMKTLKAELTRELSSGFLNALDAYTSQVMNIWTLIVDSYTYVIYDITGKLGVDSSSVDSVLTSLASGWSAMWARVASAQEWLLTNFPVWQQKSWEHMEFARQKAAEHGGKAFETATEYAGVAQDHALELKDKLSEIKVEQELKKVKAHPQVDAFIKFCVTSVKMVFPDMDDEPIIVIVEYTLLTSVFFIFVMFTFLILRMVLRCMGRMCCSRGKSIKATVNPVVIPQKRMPEDYSPPKKKKGSKKKGKKGRH